MNCFRQVLKHFQADTDSSQNLSIELGPLRLAVDDDDAAPSLGDEVDSVAAIVTELRG